MIPRKIQLLALAALLVLTTSAQPAPAARAKQKTIYHKGWIDFNKNGLKDVYEDPARSVEERVEDLLSQMTTDEKTCQLVTVYG